MSARRPALPDLFIADPRLFLLFEPLSKSARPAIAALFDPEESCAAAVAAPVPCLNPFGGRNHGGVLPSAVSRSSILIFAAALAAATFDAVELLLFDELLLTPDDLTLLVVATLSRNLLSNLCNSKMYKKWNGSAERYY